jgi:hypothetical protein
VVIGTTPNHFIRRESMSKKVMDMIKKGQQEYFGQELNVVQIYQDPNVAGCYVCRVEDDNGNWCFVLNLRYGSTLDDCMIEDSVELKPGEKITSKLFSKPRFI